MCLPLNWHAKCAFILSPHCAFDESFIASKTHNNHNPIHQDKKNTESNSLYPSIRPRERVSSITMSIKERIRPMLMVWKKHVIYLQPRKQLWMWSYLPESAKLHLGMSNTIYFILDIVTKSVRKVSWTVTIEQVSYLFCVSISQFWCK